MLNDTTTPKVANFLERFEQLHELVHQLPVMFLARTGDLPSVWDLTNNVCDRHHIAHS